MATRKSKSVPKALVKSAPDAAPDAALTLTIPVLKPRNHLAASPLLKKSAAHTDAQRRDQSKRGNALEVKQDLQDALNRRRGGGYKGDSEGGDSD